jgi:manganese efflux pump family protein
MEELLATILIGISLSMDAFSVSLLYGTLSPKLIKSFLISAVVGIYHFIMPLLGNEVGVLVISKIPINPNHIVAIIFIIISLEMFLSIIREERTKILDLIGIILFGMAVSIDSFLAGIGLNVINENKVQAATIFSVLSFVFTYNGLLIGGKISKNYGKYSSVAGGLLLIIIAIYYLTK